MCARWEWYLAFVDIEKKQDPLKRTTDVFISSAGFDQSSVFPEIGASPASGQCNRKLAMGRKRKKSSTAKAIPFKRQHCISR
ncbi:hypothetical protein AcW1_007033 [Taiwanofungus camphoratus]|nr:hypothetical protein AcV5_002837 [Antrodia cinnamomea]KAI0925096.1 hypothetical protein AcW2_005785 [Antrodia cinnamomea]KAI0929684.1 hypothetical protein AcV7_005161 [Antrodia cinnamomea]KAI0955450.1 hypothetical protein AcW1_007033 [Antrodia cinnamomea]